MLHNREHCIHVDRCPAENFKESLACMTQHNAILKCQEIAKRAHLRYRRLLAYADPSQDGNIPAVKLIDVINVVGVAESRGVLSFMLQPIAMMAVSQQQASSVDRLADKALDASVAQGRVVELVRDALRDSHLDPRERDRIVQAARATQHQNAELEAAALAVCPIRTPLQAVAR